MKTRANLRVCINFEKEFDHIYTTKLVSCLVDALYECEEADYVSYNNKKKCLFIRIHDINERTYPWVDEFTKQLMIYINNKIGNIKDVKYSLMVVDELKWNKC